jgi:hypothetical protein
LIIPEVAALFNEFSSTQLINLFPLSGATYVYAMERLGGQWALSAG